VAMSTATGEPAGTVRMTLSVVQRLVNLDGADILGVREGPVISEECALQMAEGVRKLLGTDVGLSVTGVAGPARQEDQPVGTAWLGVALPSGSEAVHLRLPGDRLQIRELAATSVLDLLRRRLLASRPSRSDSL